MKDQFQIIIKKFLPQFLYKFIRNNFFPFFKISYSQEGEDIIINRFFSGKKNGFYIDIGAHHPFRYSNTALFYKKGWRGLNIDVAPGSKKIFDKKRKRDINIEIGIGLNNESKKLYIFNDYVLNTFVKDIADKYIKSGAIRLEERIVHTAPLSNILNQHLKKGFNIDFMSIDVEGFDFDVLRSNDWDNFSPNMILCEINEGSKDNIENFLVERGYEFAAKTFNTIFFIKKNVSIFTHF